MRHRLNGQGGVIAVTKEGEYILACNSRPNDTSSSDVWIIKLDIHGKMLWNKYIGQPFEDQVTKILLDSKGDILVIGYTWLSADSASDMGWMFKLASDGKKLWNKNLGKIDINASAIDQNDRIYIGGSIIEDSVSTNYMLSVFNYEARKVSERVFTGQGRINDLSINPNGQILISGSNWLSLLDNRRYLIWEDTLKYNLKSMRCLNTSDGCFFTGSGNESVFYARYLMNGKKSWFQEYPKSDTFQTPVDIVLMSPTIFAVAEQKASGGKIKFITTDGKVQKVTDINGNFLLNNLTSFSNGLGVLVNNGDLLIIKFMSETSF
jgi:hypothetical protein